MVGTEGGGLDVVLDLYADPRARVSAPTRSRRLDVEVDGMTHQPERGSTRPGMQAGGAEASETAHGGGDLVGEPDRDLHDLRARPGPRARCAGPRLRHRG